MVDSAVANRLFDTKPNLTWEETIGKHIRRGYSGDALYREIINASQRNNADVNKALGILPK
jgi:hypothetical protein